MAVKVLIVDDSLFFQRRLSEMLNQSSRIEVVAVAVDGKDAIEKTLQFSPDVITMDVEMPLMNGIDAVREIMKVQPTPILMLSSLTREGARATFDALDAGALDFVTKRFKELSEEPEKTTNELINRILQLSLRTTQMRRQPTHSAINDSNNMPYTTTASSPERKNAGRPFVSQADFKTNKVSMSSPVTTREPNSLSQTITDLMDGANASTQTPVVNSLKTQRSDSSLSLHAGERVKILSSTDFELSLSMQKRYGLLVIGASTGGPVALQNILTSLPANFPVPILLVQHMPASFTSAFATRLNSICSIQVKEAEDGDVLQPGCAYLAPGGMQMLLNERANRISIIDSGDKVRYRPSVDLTFASVSAAKWLRGDILSIILTGMGSDGSEGAKLIQANGGAVWAQNESSCVVYGMPKAIVVQGTASAAIDIVDMSEYILKAMKLK